jgi:hypothetical protein
VHHLPADALDLVPVAVVAQHPADPEPGGEGFLEVLGCDRADRAGMLGVAVGVRGAPLAVGLGAGDVGDLGMDVQLHVTVPAGVLQPVRHHQVRLPPLPCLPAVHAVRVGAGAGVAGLPLEVPEPSADSGPDHGVHLADHAVPVRRAFPVSGQAGEPGVLAEGGVEDRDRLGQRHREVEVQRAAPGPARRLHPQLALALGRGVRLGG